MKIAAGWVGRAMVAELRDLRCTGLRIREQDRQTIGAAWDERLRVHVAPDPGRNRDHG
jgi:hypothetical protein